MQIGRLDHGACGGGTVGGPGTERGVARQLTAKLTGERQKLSCRVVVGRAIHPDGMPLPRASTQPLRSFGIGLLLAIAGVGCHTKETPPTGDVLATLVAPRLDGSAFDATALKGKPSLVMFVSPTCPHCLDEIPRADKVAKEQNANAVAVFVVGKAENAQPVVDKTKFGGTALLDDGTLKTKYGIKAVPYTLVLGADGFAKSAFRGAQSEDTLSDAVKSAR
ncbi:hypothetical protein BH11MYX2_BH11MYX2_29320 [soil metagenome]